MIQRKSHKLISAILAIVMLLSTMAYADPNINTGPIPQPHGTPVDGWSRVGLPDGYRISIYFAKENGVDANGKPTYGWGLVDPDTKSPLSFKVGKSVDFRPKKIADAVAHWGTGDVYEYTTKGYTDLRIKTHKPNVEKYDYEIIETGSKVFDQAEIKAEEQRVITTYKDRAEKLAAKGDTTLLSMLKSMQDMPLIVEKNLGIPCYTSYGDAKNPQRTGEEIRNYFNNAWVIGRFAATAGQGKFTIDDFIIGRYKGEPKDDPSGYEYPKGIYKIFIEPLYYSDYAGYYTMRTWRELIVEDTANQKKANPSPTAIGYARTRSIMLANGTFLQRPEPVLILKKNEADQTKNLVMGSLIKNDTITVFSPGVGSSKIRENYDKEKFGGNYLGVGVVTSPSIGQVGDQVKVITTYVKVTGLAEDGSFLYEEAKKPDVTTVTANKDSGTIPVDIVLMDDGGTGILNDIVVSPKNAQDISKVEWTGAIPEVTDQPNFISPNGKDIPHFLFGYFSHDEEVEKKLQEYRDTLKLNVPTSGSLDKKETKQFAFNEMMVSLAMLNKLDGMRASGIEAPLDLTIYREDIIKFLLSIGFSSSKAKEMADNARYKFNETRVSWDGVHYFRRLLNGDFVYDEAVSTGAIKLTAEGMTEYNRQQALKDAKAKGLNVDESKIPKIPSDRSYGPVTSTVQAVKGLNLEEKLYWIDYYSRRIDYLTQIPVAKKLDPIVMTEVSTKKVVDTDNSTPTQEEVDAARNAKIEYETEFYDTNLPMGGNGYDFIDGEYVPPTVVPSGTEGSSLKVDSKTVALSDEVTGSYKGINKNAGESSVFGDDEYNVVYLRYIYLAKSNQVNVIRYLKNGVPTGEVVLDTSEIALYDKNTLMQVDIDDPTAIDATTGYYYYAQLEDISTTRPEYSKAVLRKYDANLPWYYYSNTRLEKSNPNNLPTSDGVHEGNVLNRVEDFKMGETIYVFWDIDEQTPNPGNSAMSADVEEWRLSRYRDAIKADTTARMSFTLHSDGCCDSYLTDNYYINHFKTINPNGKDTVSKYDPANMSLANKKDSNGQYMTWFHTKVVRANSASYIWHNNTNATVDITANFNAIKSDSLSGIKIAKWAADNTVEGALALHGLTAANKGNPYSGNALVTKSALLQYDIRNTSNYYHTWHSNGYTCYWGDHHHSTYSETIYPEGKPNYTPAESLAEASFARYIPQNTDANKLIVPAVKKEANGKTTVEKQENAVLNVYPEYAMLFENDKGDSSIVFAVSDLARKIQPVSFHSMKYTTYFTAKSLGTSVATSMTAKNTLLQKKWGNIPVIHKGSAINTTFDSKLAKGAAEKGILTVKTFALDIGTNVAGENLKSAWGNAGYDTADIRDDFLSSFGTKNASTGKWSITGVGTENLEIDDIQPKVTNQIVLTEKEGAVAPIHHRLTVRGGQLVEVDNRPLNAVQASNPELYEALVGMKLIGAKDTTVFKTYARQTGAALTEQEFADKARLVRDGANEIAVGSGWYSEDSSEGVLIVTEYTTIFELPISAFADKIPMTVKGLNTPVDKTKFYTQMLPGYTKVNYSIKSKDMGAGLGNIESFVEHSTKDGVFGERAEGYAVPNVSISDTFGF